MTFHDRGPLGGRAVQNWAAVTLAVSWFLSPEAHSLSWDRPYFPGSLVVLPTLLTEPRTPGPVHLFFVVVCVSRGTFSKDKHSVCGNGAPGVTVND